MIEVDAIKIAPHQTRPVRVFLLEIGMKIKLGEDITLDCIQLDRHSFNKCLEFIEGYWSNADWVAFEITIGNGLKARYGSWICKTNTNGELFVIPDEVFSSTAADTRDRHSKLAHRNV